LLRRIDDANCLRKGYNVITLKDCTAALSEEEQRNAVEKNYPMFSRPVNHREFLGELGAKKPTKD